MKKVIISLVAIFALSAVPQQADAHFFKKLGKALNGAGKVVNQVAGAAGALTGGKTAKVLNKVANVAGNVSNTASAFTGEETEEMISTDNSMTQNFTDPGYSQDGGISIVTGHPDFKIQVTRCAASGKTVVMDMVFLNNGTTDINDISVKVWGYTEDFGTRSEIIDTEGNIYKDRRLSFRLSTQSYTDDTRNFSIIPGVKMKVSMKVEGVAENAEAFARILMCVDCPSWGLSWEKPVQIRNVPITRE